MPASYFPIYLVLLMMIIRRRNEDTWIYQYLLKRKKREEKTHMLELAKRFIGKDCIVYTFNGNQYTGTVQEVSDGAILLQTKQSLEAINLDFVIRLREHPRKKNGQKKDIVLD